MWQRCQTHFSRNLLDKVPKKHRMLVHSKLRDMYESLDEQVAKDRRDNLLSFLEDKSPQAATLLDESFSDVMTVLNLPQRYRRRLRTTNSIERLNEEIRRRERVIRIFPNAESAMRLIGALLLEQHEVWSTGRLYFNMDEFWEWKREQEREKDDTSANRKLGAA